MLPNIKMPLHFKQNKSAPSLLENIESAPKMLQQIFSDIKMQLPEVQTC